MDQKQTNKLFSWAGALVIGLIVVIVNYLFGFTALRTRIDLTEDKLYTLSQGTVNILKALDTNVSIRYYRTEDKEMLPEHIQVYIRRVEDILNEYKKRGRGSIELELLDPQPDSDEEVAALQDGVRATTVNLVEAFYNGIVVQCLDEKIVLPALDPNRETLLEYELSRAMAEVTRTGKPKIAIMTDEPINGNPGSNPMDPRGGGGSPPWFLPQLLERDYEVGTIPLSTEEIEDDVDLLLLVHPKRISERSEYAIDQFVLRGGKLVACLDPKFYFGQAFRPNPMAMGGGGSEPSNLEKLLPAWGLSFSVAQVLADVAYMTAVTNNQRSSINEPRVLSLNSEAFNQNTPATASLQKMLMWEAGVFTGTPADGLEKTALISSTEKSALVTPAFMYGNDAEQIMADFKADGKKYDLALIVAGKFKTAFPEGPPAEEESEEDAEEESEEDAEEESENDEAENEEGDAEEEKPEKEHLKESDAENSVVLIGDVDMLHDRTFVNTRTDFFTGQSFSVMGQANLVLLQNLLEQMAGNDNLIKIRSRTAAQRSFIKLRKMDEESEKNYRDAANEGQAEVDKAQSELARILIEGKGKNVSAHNVDPETQKAIEKMRATFAEAKKKLRQINLERRRDKEALVHRVKAANILLMPILVILLGVVLALIRKTKTAAR